MSITSRRYKLLADFERVHQFLTDTYDRQTLNSYLLPQYFEYAHHLQWFDYIRSHRFGIWEDDGTLIGIACYEQKPGTCLIHIKNGFTHLLPEMLAWSERELSAVEDGKRQLDYRQRTG
jgi:hypothetical protein